MRISDWSSDVCSSDLLDPVDLRLVEARGAQHVGEQRNRFVQVLLQCRQARAAAVERSARAQPRAQVLLGGGELKRAELAGALAQHVQRETGAAELAVRVRGVAARSEEHTSELQSPMRLSYAVF